MMNLPLFTVDNGTNYIDCYTSDRVKRILREIWEKNNWHMPNNVKVYLWGPSWIDISDEFIKGY